MKKIILAFAMCCIATPVFADKPAPPPVHHKKHKKVTVVVTPPPAEVPPVVVPPVEEPTPLPPVVVTPPVVLEVQPLASLPPTACKPHCPPENTNFIASAHLAVGVGAQAPWASGLLGLRMEFPKLMLGLEPFVSVPYGIGVDGMVYAYRGPVVQVYPLVVGFMLNWNYHQTYGIPGARYLSDQDVERVVDLRVGAGLQVKVACHIKLTLDWRVSIPDPVKLSNENGICRSCGNGSHALDANAAVGNAFAQSQLLVGLLF